MYESIGRTNTRHDLKRSFFSSITDLLVRISISNAITILTICIVFCRSETIKKMLDVMFSGEKNESSLIGGISVILALLEPPKTM